MEKDFTLFIDYTQGANINAQNMLAHCMQEISPYPGLALQMSKNDSNMGVDGLAIRPSIPSSQGTHNKIVLRFNTQTKREELYVNSMSNTYGGTYSIVTFDKNLYLGCYVDESGNKGRYWNGTIHDCKVWYSALSDEEIEVLLEN